MKYDLIVYGGGTSGVACAYIAAKKGINTLLVEKNDVLGGAITQGLVIPSMKTDTQGINTEFFNDLKQFSDKYNARTTYIDGNEAWFNPELLKIVFDDMLSSVKCNVLFSTEPVKVDYDTSLELFKSNLNHKILSLYIESDYIVDATSCGKIFQLLNCNFQNSDDKIQNPSLRFTMSNIDLKAFSDWILDIDKDRNITTADTINGSIHLSTAYTWDTSKNWALAPIFKKAIENNDLEFNDSAYFQVFSIPNMKNSLAFNCPRIILQDDENPNDPFVYSRCLKQGRERIYRLSNFFKKYFKGFENATISHISDTLGVRESYRIKGKIIYTKEDILNNKDYENVALASNYPIDIHSNSNNTDKLEYTNHTYYLPLEALISDKYDNLYAIGRILSADFEAQAALRTQQNCFSMGEAVAKNIATKLNK